MWADCRLNIEQEVVQAWDILSCLSRMFKKKKQENCCIPEQITES
jgi:hypothetical protein